MLLSDPVDRAAHYAHEPAVWDRPLSCFWDTASGVIGMSYNPPRGAFRLVLFARAKHRMGTIPG